MSDTILITGASSGLGLLAARELARQGRDLVLGCRNEAKAAQAADSIRAAAPDVRVEVAIMDTSSIRSVHEAAARIADSAATPLAGIVCNAGIQIVDGVQSSADGYEMTFATNHLGHFHLVEQLRGALTPQARIIAVASEVHQGPAKSFGFPAPRWDDPARLADPAAQPSGSGGRGGRIRYATSKLANIYYIYELARRLAGSGVTANAFDPGLMPETGLARNYPSVVRQGYQVLTPLLTKLPGAATAAQSATDLAWLATSPDVAGVSGKYYSGRREHASSRESYDTGRAAELWQVSEQLVRKALD
ncbi:SDR family NAD(P)-dependent oxidoreductase [Nocardia wallacei]|uniref:SDR family NAD(P)-dependent oxidoreductase n=1 Tax=Nocardia wallacei TaxID=480035 RepID=UPI002456E6D1|nr:SDR family NAD(P)-dependent oxidoreductase [Nocardia wallacei]